MHDGQGRHRHHATLAVTPRAAAAINVTPMVDVMLVLTIIFMVVTPLLTAGFRAELPRGPGSPDTGDRDTRIVLGIDDAGRYFVGGTPIAAASLEDVLVTIYSHRTTDKILYLQADRHLRYQRVLDAITIARRAGVRVVAAVTEDHTNTAPDRPRSRSAS